MKIIHNVETNEIIEREFTAEELIQLEKDKKEIEAGNKVKAAKEAARQAVLDKLGLTAEDIAALGL
jgi:phosphopantetheinyl transferase (holo-ACP synthase)